MGSARVLTRGYALHPFVSLTPSYITFHNESLKGFKREDLKLWCRLLGAGDGIFGVEFSLEDKGKDWRQIAFLKGGYGQIRSLDEYKEKLGLKQGLFRSHRTDRIRGADMWIDTNAPLLVQMMAAGFKKMRFPEEVAYLSPAGCQIYLADRLKRIRLLNELLMRIEKDLLAETLTKTERVRMATQIRAVLEGDFRDDISLELKDIFEDIRNYDRREGSFVQPDIMGEIPFEHHGYQQWKR